MTNVGNTIHRAKSFTVLSAKIMQTERKTKGKFIFLCFSEVQGIAGEPKKVTCIKLCYYLPKP